MKQSTTTSSKTVQWLKRIGIGGFIFFLVKGLLWLAFFFWLSK
jgi:hypothetical protein